MTYAIITSADCIAGQNIKQKLLEIFPFKDTGEKFDGEVVYSISGARVYTSREKHIFCEHIDTRVPEDKIIFPSTHRSEQGVKSLCVHVPGNWGKADLGGEEGKICSSMPQEMRTALLKLKELASGSDFEVTIEATHHGPAVDKPVMFIEIGSNETNWREDAAGIIIAKAIMHTISSTQQSKSVVILGGGHYNQAANKVLARTEYSVGHICPKHSLPLLTERLLKDAVEKTPGFEMVLLDWKGLGSEKDKVKRMLEELGINYHKYQKLTKEEDA